MKQAFLAERLRSEALIASRVGQYGRLAAMADEVERLEARLARVEALAAQLGTRPTILTTQGHAQLQIVAALADPERDHVAEADEIRKQRQG